MRLRTFGWNSGVVAACVAVLLAVSAPSEARDRQSGTSSAKSAASSSSRASAQARRGAKPTVRGARKVSTRRVARAAAPSRPSFGQIYGLHATLDPLDLKSSVALVVDQDSHEVLLSKNSEAVLPIASITKLMTAMVVSEAGLPLDESLTIDQDDVDTQKGSHSRLAVGTSLTREEMLHLALMASENRAAHALGRHYPGGLPAFVNAMNRKARELGMHDTRYVEPTGLSSDNQSSARDLATLVQAAYQMPLLRQLSTSPEFGVAVGNRRMEFRSTNGLVHNPLWDIGLQKTGYIAEAGRCLVMQATLAGRKLIMVFLDSAGRYSRIGDAERVRKWLADSGDEPEASTAAGSASETPSFETSNTPLHSVSMREVAAVGR